LAKSEGAFFCYDSRIAARGGFWFKPPKEIVMSHYIDKFTVERSGNFVRLVVGGHALGLGQEEARRLADALEQANKDELVFGGETGERIVLGVETAATGGDRWISVEVPEQRGSSMPLAGLAPRWSTTP
jgi:hypothetical protein